MLCAVHRLLTCSLPAADRASGGKPGILVADDEPAIRLLLQTALLQHGFPAVWLAADGWEAIEIYQRNRIDLVLLDVRMPGLDGPRTLEALQRFHPSVLCCFMSADTADYTVDDLYDRGAVDFLPKPFSLTQVVQTVGRLARIQRAAAI